MGPYLLKPKIGKHLNTITLNLTEGMIDHFSDVKNRSQTILNVMRDYLDTFSNDKFTGVDKRKCITISKPNERLYAHIYLAVKSGLSLSRSELFREAIRWDMQRNSRESQGQLEEDEENGVVRVPNVEKEIVYKIIGTA